MMFLQEQTVTSITDILRQFTGSDDTLRILNSVSGGSINKCFQIAYGALQFFLKVNSVLRFPGMFEAEAKGLKVIAASGTIKVPAVVGVGSTVREQFLILEWLEEGVNNTSSQQALGGALARLHQQRGEYFGLDHDNYMGSLTQSNRLHTSWAEFFVQERLEPQLALGRRSGLLTKRVAEQFEALCPKLNELCPFEEPALIHGDLWAGNYMINSLQEPVLFDPAIAYANREADIAMTRLFGGFQQTFYDSYNEQFPLQKGWEERADLWNLYPLLIHINLFGVSYLGQVLSILNRFI